MSTTSETVTAGLPSSSKSAASKKLNFARALVFPALIVSILTTQIPFLATIYYSFQNWNLSRPNDPVTFAGFDNYAKAFTGGQFFDSLWSTVLITGSSVILSLGIGMGFALLLDRKFAGQGIIRTLMITPFLIMPAAAALFWKESLFNANYGLISWLFSLFGMSPIAWTTDQPILMVVIVLTWQYTPFMMLLLLAGLGSQPQDVLEAAAVDGAGPLRRFFSMTLPHLRTYIELGVLLGTILLLQAFDPIAVMTEGSGGTKTLPYLLYERAFKGFEIGEAAALGVLTVILMILVATVALRTLFKVFRVEGTR